MAMFGRFPLFSAFVKMDDTLILLQGRKQQKPTKLGHLNFPASRGRAPVVICNRQQNALVPLTTRQKRNAETRARICLVWVGDRLNAATGTASKRVPV